MDNDQEIFFADQEEREPYSLLPESSSTFVGEEPDVPYSSQKDFITLRAWQKCRELKNFFYREIIPSLPREEMYALSNQIRRASVSATANIAEGYGRYHFKEGIQFYRIARGSIYELKDHLITCSDLNYISREKFLAGLKFIEDSKSTLNGFINFVRKKQSES